MGNFRKYFNRSCAALAFASMMTGVVGPTIAVANVEQEMQSYYRDMGSAQYNVTGTSSYYNQAGGSYSGGSVFARFPQKSVNPINIQLPTARGGCGGIDIFGGSFSFISADQFIAMAKSILNNAKGYVFKLAISALSGLIGAQLGDLQKLVTDLNSANINSCQTAQAAVNRMIDAVDLADTLGCQSLSNKAGYSSDWSAAMQDCTDPKKRAKASQDASKSNDPDVRALSAFDTALPHNVTWKMLMLNEEFRNRSPEFNEMIMTLVGTIIVTKKAEGEGNQLFHRGGDPRTVLQAFMDGGSNIPVLKCKDNHDVDGCIEVETQRITIDPTQSIKGAIRSDVQKIKAAVINNTALGQEQKDLLANTAIPVYKIIVVLSARGATYMSSSDLDMLSDLVAIDMVDRILSSTIQTLGRSQMASTNASPAEIDQWRQQFQGAIDALATNRSQIRDRLDALQGLVQRTQLVEATFQNNLSSQMQSSLGFARAMRSGGGLQ